MVALAGRFNHIAKKKFIAYVIILFLTTLAFGQKRVVLGSDNIQRTLDGAIGGQARAFPVVANSSGKVNSLYLYLDGANSASTVWVGLYGNNLGHPGMLLSQAAIRGSAAGQWNAVAIPSVQVTQGIQYWVALLGVNGNVEFRDRGAWGAYRDCYSETSYQASLTSLPATWSTGSQSASCIISMFGSASSLGVSITVSPNTASMQVGQESQFAATVSGTSNTAVTWSASGGTVSTAGLYTAPSSPGSYSVTATSVADSSKFASATVAVASPISVTVAPTSANLLTGGQQQFTATVSGTSNTAVTWTASGGTVSTAGLYTAPSSPGTYTVTARSVADSSKFANATVTVASPISVTVSPTSANLTTGGQQQFTATVSGTSNTAVTWTASGGTVSTAGLYTAPSSPGTYTVTATSVADSSKLASATVTVASPISVTVAPTSANLLTGGQQQFTATVSGTSSTAVTWTASGGTVSTAGLYTAPSSPGTYTVTARSVADSSKFANATVTVASPISITVSPTSANLLTGGQQQFTAYISGTSNTSVSWSASGGIINSAGLYTAPATAGTYTVQATSSADSTKSASASVVVTVPSVSVTITPTSTSMPERWQQQFIATVAGTSNTAVTWAVTSGAGTISSSGLYTAPAAAETDMVTVTSQADTTKSASATVSIVPPHSVSLTWSPSASSGVTSYNVYRGTVSGGPYTRLHTGVITTTYTDSNVQSGTTYYYVTTAVDSSGAESAYSNEAQANIPMP
jgi:hypothetical protein